MKKFSRASAKFLLSICFLFSASTFFAQTPGLIVRDGTGVIPPATKSSVLDPNQDGYTSASTAGFSGTDVGIVSEIPFKVVPALFPEPTADLRRGATGFFSEIVRTTDGSGFYIFFDAVNNRILMRLRVSAIMSGSKGYSALIDMDNKFGATGPGADPTYQAQTTGTNGNPGFEYEVVYETNFRIAVYDVNNSCGSAPNPVWSIDLTNATNSGYAQTSVALTTDGGNADYFYDWWVPVSAFSGTGGAITSSTPLRIQTTTVMSPQGAICGPKSDLYGDDLMYGTPQSQYEATVQAQPPFTLADMTGGGTGIGPVCTAAPTVTSPIASSATSISGTWTKASYSSLTTATITVYKNGIFLGTTSATSGGTWTLTGITVANNDVITAKAQATGESQCLSSNSVLILSCTPATSSICPTVTCFTDKGAEGTGIPGATLRIYRYLSSGVSVDFTVVIPAGGNWGWAASGSTGNATNVCATGSKDLLDGTYFVTQQEPGKCESACITPYCVTSTGTTTTPVITTDPVFTGTSAIAGTAVSGSTVRLYLNSVLQATATATGGNFSFPISSYYPQLSDVFTVSAQSAGQCISAPAATKTVVCFISAPIINANASSQVGVGTQLSGLSSEAAGTTVTVYNASTNAVIGTTTVLANGTWTLSSPTVAAATTYLARHTGTACGTSGASTTVSSLALTASGRCGTITGPVNENAGSVSGTLGTAVASTTVNLYIDGTLIGTTTTSTTTWGPIAVNTNYLNKIYPGGVLSIGISTATTMEIICPSTVTVSCVPPATPVISLLSGSPGPTPGTVSYTITNSEVGVLYTLEDNITGTFPTQTLNTDRSSSQFGNGGNLTLTSTVFSEAGNYNLKISALKLTGLGCNVSTTLNSIAPLNNTSAINDENSTWQDVNVSGAVVANDYDAENNTQTFGSFLLQNLTGTIVTGATLSGVDKTGATIANAGTLSFDASGNYTFDPATTFTGSLLVPYRICDNGNLAACDTAFLLISVDPQPNTGINTLIANNDENISYGGAVSSTLFYNDKDPQNDAFTVTLFRYDSNGDGLPDVNAAPGTVTVAGVSYNGDPVANAGSLTINANGTYTYTPSVGFVGKIDVPYIITDAVGASTGALLHIDVLADANGPGNDAPFAGDDFGYTTINLAVSGSVLSNDSDPNSNGLSVTAQTTTIPGVGTLVLASNGTYTFTPVTGYVGPATFTYQVCDVTAVAPQPLCADAVLHILVGPGININGKVWIDANGNVIDPGAAEAETNAGGTLYVNLVNGAGNVVATSAVAADGTYSFTDITPGISYSLVLSTTQGTIGNTAPAASLPAGWIGTGETRNGTIDLGTLNVIDNLTYGFTNTVNFDFGIEQLPTATVQSYTIPAPALNSFLTLNGTGAANSPAQLSGTDPEDGTIGTGNTMTITAVPANAELYYDFGAGPVLLSNNINISNYDPSKLQVKFTTLGSQIITFSYTIADAAGKTDPTAATYTINMLSGLPVEALSLSAGLSGTIVTLNWKTLNESNTSYFEIERSTDNRSFAKTGNRVSAAGSSVSEKLYNQTDDLKDLQATSIVYYRIKLTDVDGKVSYSNVVAVRLSKAVGIKVWPNPFVNAVQVQINSLVNTEIELRITDVKGRTILVQRNHVLRGNNQLSLENLQRLASGTYLLQVVNKSDLSTTNYKLTKQ
jgi:large repetitive protein